MVRPLLVPKILVHIPASLLSQIQIKNRVLQKIQEFSTLASTVTLQWGHPCRYR